MKARHMHLHVLYKKSKKISELVNKKEKIYAPRHTDTYDS